MTKKPCLTCKKECEIFAIQLGDFATLTYLRVCDFECFFGLVHDFLYEIYQHKELRNFLYKKQDEEDKKELENFHETSRNLFLNYLKESLERNPNLLTTPSPNLEMFKNNMPINSGTTMRFVRPSKECIMQGTKNRIEELKNQLQETQKDLENLEKQNDTNPKPLSP